MADAIASIMIPLPAVDITLTVFEQANIPANPHTREQIIKAMILLSITEQSHRQGRLPSIVHQKHQNAGKYKRKSCSLLIRETKR